MELEAQADRPGAPTTSTTTPSPVVAAASIVPQKRKGPPAEGDFPPSAFAPTEAPAPSESAASTQPDKDEYETGRVLCEACGERISFRDEEAGTFTVKHWDAHRFQCPNASQQAVKTASRSPEPLLDVSAPPPSTTKRRRAKRTEDERIAYLRDDPYVAQFEAYRVLCASCDKWIRLRPNSTYCSIPWDAHRKSCLAKRVAKNSHPGDDRSILFSGDPTVRKFDSERVQCRNCEEWITIGAGDNLGAANDRQCSAAVQASDSSDLTCYSKILAIKSRTRAILGNFVPAQESRRRNAEQREAALRSDPLISEVEPNRVFCSVCRKWVQLRQDSTYCAYPWVQHRGKCLARHQRRVGKETELNGSSPAMQRVLDAYAKSETGPEDSEGDESEESGSTDEEIKARRKAHRREERRKAKEAAWMARLRQEEEQRRMIHYHRPLPPAFTERGLSMDMDEEVRHPPRLADLETSAGRLDFVSKSIRYLFKTTYERSDELTIANLVTYLNAAIPLDKHEDFDTTEVTKAAAAISDRGEFVLEGDVLRFRD
ncbi:hypothetical protein EIP91_011630 [Steccherinum ochraceum]|uniref:Uncharacterized protein n=1 Tax=Steccherinum ochraceum TaxID=92696 RepID=A0A4R0RRE9_9APHY|nr:hypothetical protein EIP91_011630 [Steccherinum ochraceum]